MWYVCSTTEYSFLVDSVNSVMDAGYQTSYAEIQGKIGIGDNYLGALFLTGLETLWRKKEESQKLSANMVNPRPCLLTSRAKQSVSLSL
jgi:hypothetical protein